MGMRRFGKPAAPPNEHDGWSSLVKTGMQFIALMKHPDKSKSSDLH